MAALRLGRKPANPAKIAAAPQMMKLGAVRPPARLQRHNIQVHLGMYGNDTLPDCTAAGLANAASSISALNGFQVNIDPHMVREFYAECAGVACTETAMEASDGCELIDVLQRQAQDGFNIGPETLFAEHAVVPLGRIAMANCMNRLGIGYMGVDLYQSDMEETTFWDYSGANPGPLEGGHCVICFDYTGLGDTDTVRIGTWGSWTRATWRWIENRTEEVHCMAWKDLTKANGTEWSGITYDQLKAECLAGAQ